MTLKIRYKKLAKGYETCFFDIHDSGNRWTEATGIKFKSNPSTNDERKDKKEKTRIIQILASKRETELLNGRHGLIEGYKPTENFVAYMDFFIENHNIKDIKKFHAVRAKFVEYVGKDSIFCYSITESFLRGYVQFLEKKLNGESAANYFAKLKQILKAATSENLFKSNPAENIRVRKTVFLQKDVLNVEEIGLLSDTHLERPIIKDAFLFCLVTGLRFCDVSILKWSNVTSSSIRIVQAKTNVPLDIPLNSDAIALLPKKGNPNEKVFELPSHASCQKWLKILVEKAGVEKKISWHSGRHSYASNLIIYGVDVSIVSKLIGHTSLVNTQRYLNINNITKAAAVAKLPTFSRK